MTWSFFFPFFFHLHRPLVYRYYDTTKVTTFWLAPQTPAAHLDLRQQTSPFVHHGPNKKAPTRAAEPPVYRFLIEC
jgi:hypothetical protein